MLINFWGLAYGAEQMPEGYSFLPQPNAVARAVLGKSTWTVLALTVHIELFAQAHYRESVEPVEAPSALCKDVFPLHRKEESRPAIRARALSRFVFYNPLTAHH
jgi:hypothetical protein